MSIPGSLTPLFNSGGAAGYQISRSLRFNSADSAYLSRTPASAGNRKTWTWSGWVKRSSLGVEQRFFSASTASTNSSYFEFTSGDQLSILNYVSSSVKTQRVTTQVFRDTSAWYHIVVASNSSTSFNVYVNGSEVTAFASTAGPDASDWFFNGANLHTIGTTSYSLANYFSGYLADIHFIDGQALTPSSFAETNATTGQWVPKAYTGSYGTNGFRLDFSDNSAATATTLGKDRAGSNNWTPNNLSVTAGAGNDSLVDTPTSYGIGNSGGDVRGNYATLNPLTKASTTALSNGNLDASFSGWQSTFGTIAYPKAGKWYYEFIPGNADGLPGIADVTANLLAATGTYFTGAIPSYGYYGLNGTKNQGPSNTQSSYGSTFTSGDIIGVAFDADAGTLTFYKNGVSQGTAFSGLTGTYIPAVGEAGGTVVCNFGQRPFAYTAPSGFKALCDTNLPAPVIAKPNSVFDVALWTGNGSARSITGLNFNPDFVWIKGRSGATDHALYDAVRGATIDLASNSTAAETTQTQGLTAFNSDGFSLGTLAKVNTNTSTYAGWAWDAGSSTVTNTQGSITSQVRANASAGFSIVTYTGNGSSGATVGHGLGVSPSLIIIKSRSATSDWPVWHTSLTPTSGTLFLDLTVSQTTYQNRFDSTGMTSNVFKFGSTISEQNANSTTYVAYCFAPVAGYSAFGSYTGNGSTDGPFVYTGHRVRWLLVKNATNGGSWVLHDTARSTYNVSGQELLPDSSGAEYTFTRFDFLSNGFKGRSTNNASNTNGDTYIYAAFAENPFQYSRAR